MALKADLALIAFNAGELSPRLDGRIDHDKYTAGCSVLENFLPIVPGGAIKRSGTRHVKPLNDETRRARFVPFTFGVSDAYNLCFEDGIIRVFRNSGAVLEATVAVSAIGATTPITITTAAPSGYLTGDEVWVTGTLLASINNRFFKISGAAGGGDTTFTLDGTTSGGAFGAGGTVARVFTIPNSPYDDTDLPLLTWSQTADVLYLFHPSIPTHKLSRTDHTVWTLEAAVFDPPPFAAENFDPDDLMVASADTGTVQLYSTGGHFVAGHIGGFVKLAEDLEGAYPEWTQAAAPVGTSSPIALANHGGTNFDTDLVAPDNSHCFFQGRLYRLIDQNGNSQCGGSAPIHDTGMAYDGQWHWDYWNEGYGWVEITAVTDAWRAVATVSRRLGRTVFSPERAVTAIAHAAGIATITVGAAHGFVVGDEVFVRGTLNAAVNNRKYVVLVTAATTIDVNTGSAGASGAGGIVIKVKTANTNAVAANTRTLQSKRWAFGAFSTARGFPRTGCFFEDRLWLAGTNADPQGMWGSRTSRYDDFLLTEEADGSRFVLLNAQRINAIQWISASHVLAIGTRGGEWIFTTETSDNPDKAVEHSSFGVREGVIPLRIGSSTIFVQRAGRNLVEYGFNLDQNTFQGGDLNAFADHIAISRIREIAWQQDTDRVVWCVLENGTLAGLTYDRPHSVIGWHRHPIGGGAADDAFVESVAVIPHPDGDRDQVWLSVRRTIDGVVRRYVEFLEETWVQGTAIANSFFLDSGLSTTLGGPAASVGGLWHLIDETVSALVDGIAYEGMLVSAAGAITLPGGATGTVWHAGLPYAAVLQPMRLETATAQGTAQGKTKLVAALVVRLLETGRGLRYGSDDDHLDPLLVPAVGGLYSGDTDELEFPGLHDQAGFVRVRHATPLPCTVTGLFPRVGIP